MDVCDALTRFSEFIEELHDKIIDLEDNLRPANPQSPRGFPHCWLQTADQRVVIWRRSATSMPGLRVNGCRG